MYLLLVVHSQRPGDCGVGDYDAVDLVLERRSRDVLGLGLGEIGGDLDEHGRVGSRRLALRLRSLLLRHHLLEDLLQLAPALHSEQRLNTVSHTYVRACACAYARCVPVVRREPAADEGWACWATRC